MSSPTSNLVVYDFFAASGGAERLSLRVAIELDAEIITGFRLPRTVECFEGYQNVPIRPLLRRVGRLKAATCVLTFLRFLLPLDRRPRNIAFVSGVFSVGALLWLRAHRRVYYCHTPPKFCFEEFSYYFGRFPSWLRVFARLACLVFARIYAACLRRADIVLSNSRYTQKRLREYLGIHSEVLYPPVAVPKPTPEVFNRIPSGWRGFLSFARHEPLKRVEKICTAFTQMSDQSLVVVSSGSLTADLKSRFASYPNIRFVDAVSDSELAAWIQAARATIYLPKGEDFGMSVIESLALGTPVITVDEGGISEIFDGPARAWLLPANPSIEQICGAVRAFASTDDKSVYVTEHCRAIAGKFGFDTFRAHFRSHLARGSDNVHQNS